MKSYYNVGATESGAWSRFRETMDRKPIISWALYDWANSAFATTVMAGFFPIFFKQYWSQDVALTHSTFYLGVGNSVASLIIVVVPILGAMIPVDYENAARDLCQSECARDSLYLVQAGMWPFAILLYAIAVGFQARTPL